MLSLIQLQKANDLGFVEWMHRNDIKSEVYRHKQRRELEQSRKSVQSPVISWKSLDVWVGIIHGS